MKMCAVGRRSQTLRTLIALAIAGGGLPTVASAAVAFTPAKALDTQQAAKYGGVAWGDYNADGFPDVAIATESSVEVYVQDLSKSGSGSAVFGTHDVIPDGRFAYNKTINVQDGARSVIWADLNNDGRLDLAAAGPSRLVIALGSGTANRDLRTAHEFTWAADGDLKTGTGYKDYEYGAEGLGAIDFDGDDDLDIVLDKGRDGIRVYTNNAGVFTDTGFQTLGATGTLRADGASDASKKLRGDNLVTADANGDGKVDVWVRRENNGGTFDPNNPITTDFWKNQTTGSSLNFEGVNGASNAGTVNITTFPQLAGTPGAVVMCDLNGDGSLDAFSSGPGPDAIYTQDSAGAWQSAHRVDVASPYGLAGIDFFSAACGDIDNDGDMDLWLGRACNNCDGILENTTAAGSSSWSFTWHQNASSEIQSADTIPWAYSSMGAAFADADRDGDLDLLVNANTDPASSATESRKTYVWLNKLTGTSLGNYLAVRPTIGAHGRAAVGANVTLLECPANASAAHDSGNKLAVQAISGGEGKGSQSDAIAHFGIDATKIYVVEVQYPGGGKVYKAVKPSEMNGYHLLSIHSAATDDVGRCTDQGRDTDGDGVKDSIDQDDDNDGILDTYEMGDRDGDSVPDQIDLDSDNDAIEDIVEFRLGDDYLTWDANHDGRCDNADSTTGRCVFDTSKSGLLPVDSDADGKPDAYDLDADGDTLADILESGAQYKTLDADSNGRIDANFGVNGYGDNVETAVDSGITDYSRNGTFDRPLDFDGDDTPDFRDLDSDNDSLLDINECTGNGVDANNDGIDDMALQSDNAGDGQGNTCVTQDNDGDNQPDHQDPKDTDSDGDGLGDNTDADDDNDGIVDTVENAAGNGDVDGDGVPNRLDLDSDNDGIPDIIEALASNTYPAGDADRNSRYDTSDSPVITPTNTDGDNFPDYVDLDADGDKVPDIIERESGKTFLTLDANPIDGRIDNNFGTNGLGNAVETQPDNGVLVGLPYDFDEDGVPDYRDTDTDNDGKTDVTEVVPGEGDSDENGDGLVGNNARPTTPDQDSDGHEDFRDANDANASVWKTGLSGNGGAALSKGGAGSAGPWVLLMTIVLLARRSRRRRLD